MTNISSTICNGDAGPSSPRNTTPSKRALGEGSSCNTTKDVEDQNASDDDELEVLLVIRPPSPKRRFKSTTCSTNYEQNRIDEIEDENYKSEIIEIIQSSPSPDVKVSKFSEGPSQSPPLPSNERKASARVSLSQENNDWKIDETNSAEMNINEKTIGRQVADQTITESTASLSTATNLPMPSKQYSYRTSAYVQNLAEICYVLLWDERWRVGSAISIDLKQQYKEQPEKMNHRSSRLLQWERGDDLSAVHALSRLYDVGSVQHKINNRFYCTKCLCRDSSLSSTIQIDDTPATKGNNDDQEKEVDDTPVLDSTENLISANNNDKATSILRMEQQNAADEDEARTLHLYCRLYYRKGPWFRLDDMYNRYYAPKNKHQNNGDPDDDEIISNTSKANNASTTPIKERKKLFFKPRQRKEGSKVLVDNDVPCHADGKTSPTSTIIDQTKIEEGLVALKVLYQDVAKLSSMGLIRSFQSEEECGKTMGAVSNEGSGVIMTAEERRCLLAKLGGARNGTGVGTTKKEQNKNPAENTSNTSTNSTMKAKQSSPNKNQVWKQMCNQRSISTKFCQNATRSTTATDENKIFLPVKKHANGIVLDKLATKIILAASKRDYLPASILRERKVEVINQIRHIQDTTTENQPSLGANIITETCFRLREAPLQSLQRCARVFLCASSGPGNMRGNGTNGWRSLLDVDGKQCHRDFPESRFVQIPSSLSWHNVTYPLLSHRFGLTSFSFMESYQNRFILNKEDLSVSPSEADKTSKREDNHQNFQEHTESIFASEKDFLAWECTVDIRANMDYLVEVNEMTLYQARRSAKEKSRDCKAKPSDDSGDSNDESESIEYNDSADQEFEQRQVAVDFLNVLTVEGRRKILNKLLYSRKEAADYNCEASTFNMFQHSPNKLIDEIEKDINYMLLSIYEVHDLKVDDTKKQSSQSKSSSVTNGSKSCFDNDCERVIAVFSVIAIRVLIARHTWVSEEELSSKLSRPWLRHMWWEGVLAYVLWDGIPILEKRGCYGLASIAMEVLLFGRPQIQRPVGETDSLLSVYSTKSIINEGNPKVMPLCPLLISRRARGKAFDRLVIDMTHILRSQSKDLEAKVEESKKKTGAKRGLRAKAVEDIESPQYKIRLLTTRLLDNLAMSGSIPFSAIRTLARRLKMPLIEILANSPSTEAIELGLRLENEKCSDVDEKELLNSKGYRDFVPKTDFAIANSLSKDNLKAGGRCSFVGFEAHENNAYVSPSSLNVEELAMEFYASGRLPDSVESALCPIKGGWVGWHDEGGYVRALFRILCFDSVLGVDGGCRTCRMATTPKKDWEDRTIFLTPYQGAPFDLHVAYSVSEAHCVEITEGKGSSFIRGFYERHRKRIEAFLTKIESSERQALCDQVHNYIVNRLDYLGAKAIHDVVLQRDLKQIRTLSMVAAGFGGKQLAAIFRCLLFDYRHYSGGLPDLLLARAMYAGSDKGSDKIESGLVDLGDWIGEGFSTERIQEKEAAHRATFLVDRDDEFLGCDKVGDSGTRSNGRWKKGQHRVAQKQKPNEVNSTELLAIPEKLSLTHRGNTVQVECMFVEVKSSNDRLDSRQEDWLNILDRNGNARVCKFGKKKK